MLPMVNGVNLDRKRRPAQSDPDGFCRKLPPRADSAQTIGGHVTEMDTSTPLSDSIGAAPEPLAAFDLAGGPPDFVARLKQSIAQSLVISFLMIMDEKLTNGIPQRILAEKNHSVETL